MQITREINEGRQRFTGVLGPGFCLGNLSIKTLRVARLGSAYRYCTRVPWGEYESYPVDIDYSGSNLSLCWR